jgi:hypothetical protein
MAATNPSFCGFCGTQTTTKRIKTIQTSIIELGGYVNHLVYCVSFSWRLFVATWQVWADALDLTQSCCIGDVECVFHYTTEKGFRNITDPSKQAVELFVLASAAINFTVGYGSNMAQTWVKHMGYPCTQ